MHISLFLLGVVTATAGFVAIGLGVPEKAFSFGNTLILAGTTAVVGGFILIGIATAVRQLRRIAQALALNTVPARIPSPSFAPLASSSMQGSSSLGSLPSNPAYQDPAQSPSEQQSFATRSVEPEPLDWLRPTYKTSGADELSEEKEPEIPLPPPRPTFPLPPKASVPAEEHPVQSGRFNKVWLVERSAQRTEIVERTSTSDTAGYSRDESQAEKEISSAPQPSAILKSGVIDGMAYTLYTDGSIEAVLATGTVRFASVDELRIHLEKHS